MKRWYIVQVLTGYEERASADLQAKIAESGLGEFFGRILTPGLTATSTEAVSESVKAIDDKEKIFPGYIILEMELTGETKRLVLETDRIAKFLGGNHPEAITENEALRILEQASGKVKPKAKEVSFAVGGEVHITSGPFEGFLGVIEAISEDREKIKVMVSIFGRMTPIELGFDQVKR